MHYSLCTPSKFLRIFFLLFTLTTSVFAQSTKTDSLSRLLELSQADTSRVQLLNDLAYEYWSKEPQKTLTYAQQALALSKKISYASGEARSYQMMGVHYWQKSDYENALKWYTNALTVYKSIPDKRGIARVLGNMGIVYREQGNDSQALENYYQALKILQAIKDAKSEANILNSIGLLYKNRKDFSQAIIFLEQAQEIWKRLGQRQSVAGVLNNIADVYLQRRDFASAIKNNEEALAIFESLKDINGQIIVHNSLGEVYLKKQEPNQALQQFQAALSLNSTYASKKGLIVTHNGLGRAFLQLQQLAQAIAHYQQAMDLAQATGVKMALRESLAGLAESYASGHDYQKAYLLQHQYTQLKDSLFSEESIAKLTSLRTNYETEKKQVEIELLKKEKQLAQWTRNGLAMGLAILLLFGTVVVRQQRSKTKQHTILLQKSKELLDTQQALAEAEQKNSQIREQQLQQELEYRSKSLTTHTLNLIQKNGIMEEIRETISEVLRNQPKDLNKQVYSRLIKLIDYSFSLDKDWEDFKLYFEQVHKDFFVKLKAKHPELSSGELKLAALVRLNLNLKESATILGISPESVKTSRHRLRKKLNLGEDQNMPDYLLSI
ncbi:tetratricopeptide repeat protein [Rhodocytophaga aerolata]|uniref:Tetratricopeptide repeat protein n=1 Tax=Rhodocytophaga aerolata TaxID=455078 RepID=A0ABT8RB00_9BACT|nr:tetratricopeptide repeat protein [Rhodocytophaga aerolata]MDO1448378.1 tetratricopeptide repeat protein [Rhodocytophaga aerolata]